MSNDMQQDVEPVRFVPFALSETATWQRPVSFTFVERLSQLALSDSELLQSSHHVPIAIDDVDGTLQVVAITARPFQRVALLDAEGRWTRGYAPIALRCLPFRLSTDVSGKETLEMAAGLGDAKAPTSAVLGEDRKPTAEITKIVGQLRHLETGKRRLRAAAETLLLAGVLTPFQMMRLPAGASSHSRVLTVDRNKFAALSHRRTALIAQDSFLPIDLAAACLFSQRLTPGLLPVGSEPREAENARGPVADHSVDFRSNAQLDDSELFSFEAFCKADS